MKSILLLGGSRQQVPAIETAKRLGYRTVLIDYLSENPGQFVADKWYQESTTDVESVYRIAKDEQVSGILAYASDPAAFPGEKGGRHGKTEDEPGGHRLYHSGGDGPGPDVQQQPAPLLPHHPAGGEQHVRTD